MPEKRFQAEFDNKAAIAGAFPLLSIKVSHLKDGTILNVKCSHFCADGGTFYRMMENWSSLARDEGFVIKPVYDDTAVSKALAATNVYDELASHDMKGTGEMLEKEGMYRIRPSVMFPMMWQKLLRIDRRLSSPVFVPYSRIAAVRDASGQVVGRNAALSAIAVEILRRPMGWTGKDINIVHTADHRGRIDFIGMDYTGNASFTLRPTTVNADLPAGQMASLIEEDMKRMLEPEYENRYLAFYHTMLERKMAYLPFDINSMWCACPTTFISSCVCLASGLQRSCQILACPATGGWCIYLLYRYFCKVIITCLSHTESCRNRRKKGCCQNKKPKISRQRVIGGNEFRNAVTFSYSYSKLKNDSQSRPNHSGQPSFLTGAVFYQAGIHKPCNQEDKDA